VQDRIEKPVGFLEEPKVFVFKKRDLEWIR